jgi:hypothetical protein
MPERYIQDHDARLYDAMLSYLRDAPNTRALLAAAADVFQNFEDMLFDLDFTTRLDNATGKFLNQWGTLVDEKRGVLDDPAYRRIIRARIQANRSNALVNDVIDIAETLFEPRDSRYFPIYPAQYRIELVTELALSDDFLRRATDVLERSRPAGVGQSVVQSPTENVLRLQDTEQSLNGPQMSRRIL